MARAGFSVLAAALMCAVAPAAARAQIPPSVRASASKPASTLTPEQLQNECAGLKETIAAMRKDVVWSRQPYSLREIRRIEKQAADLGCTITALAGTWQVRGVANKTSPVDANFTEDITLVLEAVDENTGFDEADKPYGPLRQSDFMCRAADVFYTGTMTYTSPIPWVGSSRIAKVIACGNSQSPMTSIAGRFGVLENGGVSSRSGGGFILMSDGPTEMHGYRLLMAPGAGSYQPSTDWTLKKMN